MSLRNAVVTFAWLGWMTLGAAVPAAAQHLDLTVFGGRSFPLLEGEVVLRAPAVPSLPGVQVTATGTPELRVDGGPVFGGALAVEFGVLALEGRLDATEVGFNLTGARYDLSAASGPFQGLSGSVAIGNGRLDLERVNLVSLNLRLRTPGAVGFVVSGGLSYLPDIRADGWVPLDISLAGVPVSPSLQPRLTLVARPGQADHRWGVNGGAGFRVGGRVGVQAEARVFYFRDYELRFASDVSLPYLDDLLESIDAFRFKPVVLNGQVGLFLRF